MNSMAQIMSAVGSIVTKQHKNPFKAMMRRQQRRLAREEQLQQHGQREGQSWHSDHHYPHANADQYYRNGGGNGSKVRAPAATAPYTIGLDGSVSQVPYAHPSHNDSTHPNTTHRSLSTHPLDIVKLAVPPASVVTRPAVGVTTMPVESLSRLVAETSAAFRPAG